MNPNNPFEQIMASMNAAKNNYDQTMGQLNNQLNSMRNMFNPQVQNPYGQPVMPPIPAVPTPAPAANPVTATEGIPPHVQILGSLSEIKELLQKMVDVPKEAESIKKEVKPVIPKENGSDKK